MTQDNHQELFTLSKKLLEGDTLFSESYLDQLSSVLRYHEWRYYVLNDPIISDFEYDQLFKKLQEVEKKHPNWIKADSPSQRVSSDLTSNFNNVAHIVPMLSLGNSYNGDDLKKFDETIRKLVGFDMDQKIVYTVEPKFDGGSIGVSYKNDMLVRAATRGNGERGEEITNNARQILTLPLNAAFSKMGIVEVELRGEAVIEKKRFDAINVQREAEGKPLYANPRNTAAGGLRTKDPKETKDRGTEVFIFQLGYAIDKDGQDAMSKFNGHADTLQFLKSLGFLIDQEITKVCQGINEVIAHIAEWAEKRESYPYEIDGMVVKVNNFELQTRSGSTSHHPRWAIAYKFKAKQATTTLEDVEYQVGKIGSITPVAKVTPTPLAGVTVSSISLHNEEFITSKDLRIGDKIIIERAGDVIPYIVKSLPDLRTGQEQEIKFLSNCPSCHQKLYKEEGEAAWRCINYECPAQVLQRMYHHVSKDAMDIDGFGPSIVERFTGLGWLKNIDDIYDLDFAAIAELEGFGEKSAIKLKDSIDKAKDNPIHRLLHGLSIHHLGKKASKLIAENISHVLDLQKWKFEDFIAIHEVGPVVGQNVIEYFANPLNIALLKRMEERGVNLIQKTEDKPKVVSENAPLIGKSILFTGSLQKMGRKQAQELASNAGAKNISAVSSKLDILVVGEKAGSKLKKAQALETVEILTEDQFIELIGGI